MHESTASCKLLHTPLTKLKQIPLPRTDQAPIATPTKQPLTHSAPALWGVASLVRTHMPLPQATGVPGALVPLPKSGGQPSSPISSAPPRTGVMSAPGAAQSGPALSRVPGQQHCPQNGSSPPHSLLHLCKFQHHLARLGVISQADPGWPLTVSHSIWMTLVHWRHTHVLSTGSALGAVEQRRVLSTDASNLGWGAVCMGRLAGCVWSCTESSWGHTG